MREEEDPGFKYLKLLPHGYVVGSLIAPLRELTVQDRASLHNALQLAGEAVIVGNTAEAVFAMGDVLKLLGFRYERREEQRK